MFSMATLFHFHCHILNTPVPLPFSLPEKNRSIFFYCPVTGIVFFFQYMNCYDNHLYVHVHVCISVCVMLLQLFLSTVRLGVCGIGVVHYFTFL